MPQKTLATRKTETETTKKAGKKTKTTIHATRPSQEYHVHQGGTPTPKVGGGRGVRGIHFGGSIFGVEYNFRRFALGKKAKNGLQQEAGSKLKRNTWTLPSPTANL